MNETTNINETTNVNDGMESDNDAGTDVGSYRPFQFLRSRHRRITIAMTIPISEITSEGASIHRGWGDVPLDEEFSSED